MKLNEVRLLVGHSAIQMTQRYQHLESNDVSPEAGVILNPQNVERNRSKMKIVGSNHPAAHLATRRDRGHIELSA